MNNQDYVRQFHEKFGLTINRRPTWPSDEDVQLRRKLVEEELSELLTAFSEKDIVAVADALGDLLYVVLGAGVTFGLDMDPIVDEIHRSNMTKMWEDGTVCKNEYGKVVKPPTYEPARLEEALERQSVRADIREEAEQKRQEGLSNCQHLHYMGWDPFGRSLCGVCQKLLDPVEDVEAEVMKKSKLIIQLENEKGKKAPNAQLVDQLAFEASQIENRLAAHWLSVEEHQKAIVSKLSEASLILDFTKTYPADPSSKQKHIFGVLNLFRDRLDDDKLKEMVTAEMQKLMLLTNSE